MLGAMLDAMSGHKPSGRHAEKRLSAAQVRSIKEAGFYADGNGLYLKVEQSGAKRWVQRLVINGKRRDIGLGSAALTGLAEAREKALENRKVARQGGDPIADKKLSRAILTFSEAAEQVHRLNKPSWRNGKHVDQWISTLKEYAFPLIGRKQVSAITSADVLAVLTPIWNILPETARRVKQRMGTVLKWAVAQGWRTDNPAEAVAQALPKHDRSKVRHREALDYDKVADAIEAIRHSGAATITKLAFEFLIHTVCRSGEVRNAAWSEIDLEKRVWTIPASKMKSKKVHRVPLTDRCLTLLEDAAGMKRDGDDLVFPGFRDNKPLSDMTLSKLLKELKIPAHVHGFRTSFRVWAGEKTNHPREVAEFALAHVIKDKAEAAYARTDLFEKRRNLMHDWSAFLIL